MDQAVVYIVRMFLRMIPGEYVKKMLLKAIPAAAEMLLARAKQKETHQLAAGETDYCIVILPRLDPVTGKYKLLAIEAAGAFNVKPYPIRGLTMLNLGDKIESLDVDMYKEKIRESLKDGSFETALSEIGTNGK